jgi:hypothetical protein
MAAAKNPLRASLAERGRDRVALGWLKWAQVRRQALKKALLADPQAALSYVQQREKALMAARDRALAQSWFNADKNRWEMKVQTLKEAAEGRVLAEARFAHHREEVWVRIKGGTGPTRSGLPTFFLVQLAESNGEVKLMGMGSGQMAGDGAHLLMLQLQALGVPCTVEVVGSMPWYLWDPTAFALLPLRTVAGWVQVLVNTREGQRLWKWWWEQLTVTLEETFILDVYPRIPFRLRKLMGAIMPTHKGEAYNRELVDWIYDTSKRYKLRVINSRLPRFLTVPFRTAVVLVPIVPPFVLLVRYLLHVTGVMPIERETEARYKRRVAYHLWDELDMNRLFWSSNPVSDAFKVAKV